MNQQTIVLKKKKILFGAGSAGLEFLDFVGAPNVAFFCDNYLAGTTIKNVPVLSLQELKNIYSDYVVIITPKSARFIVEIAILLHDSNIPFVLAEDEKEKIIRYSAILQYAKDNKVDIYDQSNGFEKDEQRLLCRYKKFALSKFIVERIGEMMDLLIQTDDKRFCDPNVKDIFIPMSFDKEKIANKFLYDKVCEKLNVVTKDNVKFWIIFIRKHWDKIFCYDRFNYQRKMMNQRIDRLNFYNSHREYLTFSATEDCYGRKQLSAMGLDKPYVCFFARSQKYLNTIYQKETIHPNDFCRNYSIQVFKEMVEQLHNRETRSVRMGYLVEEKVEWPGCIDYANKFRKEILDFYVISKCKFFVVGYSGIMNIAVMFNIPLAIINAHLITYTGDTTAYLCKERDLIVFKKLRHRVDNHYLTLREILRIEEMLPNQYERMQYLLDNDYEFIENTAEEIWEITKEMIIRCDTGSEMISPIDQTLRDRYWEIIMKSVHKEGRKGIWYPEAMPGKAFLRKNQWWLE